MKGCDNLFFFDFQRTDVKNQFYVEISVFCVSQHPGRVICMRFVEWPDFCILSHFFDPVPAQSGDPARQHTNSNLLRGREKTVAIFRHIDLETGTLARDAVLGDRNAGDREDLPRQKQPEPGVFPKALGKQFFLVFL